VEERSGAEQQQQQQQQQQVESEQETNVTPRATHALAVAPSLPCPPATQLRPFVPDNGRPPLARSLPSVPPLLWFSGFLFLVFYLVPN
jgi:hypothetical protein